MVRTIQQNHKCFKQQYAKSFVPRVIVIISVSAAIAIFLVVYFLLDYAGTFYVGLFVAAIIVASAFFTHATLEKRTVIQQ